MEALEVPSFLLKRLTPPLELLTRYWENRAHFSLIDACEMGSEA